MVYFKSSLGECKVLLELRFIDVEQDIGLRIGKLGMGQFLGKRNKPSYLITTTIYLDKVAQIYRKRLAYKGPKGRWRWTG